MSENFQNSPLLGTPNSLQPSLPVVSNTAPLTGRVCNFSSDSVPTVSSAWLLPSASSTSFQSLVGTTYLYQHSDTAMLSGVSSQSQISTSSVPCPGIFEWDSTGRNKKQASSLGGFPITVIDEGTVISSMQAQYDTASYTSTMVPLYPTLSASLVQGTPSQGQSLSFPHQEGNQLYYYDQGTLWPLLPGELGPCLHSYGSVPHARGRASAFPPEMVMVLKEVQPTDALPPASSSGIYCSTSAQRIPETSFQVMETSPGMETHHGRHPPSQTFCLPETPEFFTSCTGRNINILESQPPSELGDIPVIAPVQSPSNFLALPPAPSQEQTEKKNLSEVESKLPEPEHAYQMAIENQDSSLLPLDVPDIQQFLAFTDACGQEQQSGAQNIDLGKTSLSLEDQGTLNKETESSSDFAAITALVQDINLPQLFHSLEDLDPSQDPTAIQNKDTKAITEYQLEQKSGSVQSFSDPARNNKRKASESIAGAPMAKTQALQNAEREAVICNTAASDRAPIGAAKRPNSKPQKAAPSRSNKTKGHAQEKTKRARENNSKKAEDQTQVQSQAKAEEKPPISRMKRKRNQLEFNPETFKKPRSSLAMHMLESVQVFHALGKKNEKQAGLPSSRALANSSTTQDRQPPLAIKPWLATRQEGKGPEETQAKAQNPYGSAERQCTPPSQSELPPPGKLKLVPLPFLSVDNPPVRALPRKPPSLVSHRPSAAYPSQPGTANSNQRTAVNPSRPAPTDASWTHPARPAPPISTNVAQTALPKPRPSVLESAAPRPAPYKTSSYLPHQRETVPTFVTKLRSPPKPQNQYLLEDFALQPIPWRKPSVPEPVMSTPITEEQRPEREAMKRQAQRERENAAKYTSWGKVQFFIQRERDHEIAQYYGYVK